ncbi:CHC2 zinc finger domain-containing protein [Bdellovibrio sp.]|uniref:CHC2 zinc finger domain-containing protein n=1 Tax=Bdellovibrio sp. TaxID=28201 RepID=UPI0039C86EC6
MTSQNIVEEVISHTNIIEIVSQLIPLEPAESGWYRGACPFHKWQGKKGLFYVSEVKQVYRCYRCKRCGNVITFLRDYRGMTEEHAIVQLQERLK